MTIEAPPMAALLGIRLLEVAEGRALLAGQATERVYNVMGIAHGGFLATLLDSAIFCAVNASRLDGSARPFATVDLKVTYLRPLRREVGEVRCEATVIHAGKRVATAEARVVDEAGKIYAHGTATCMAPDSG